MTNDEWCEITTNPFPAANPGDHHAYELVGYDDSAEELHFIAGFFSKEEIEEMEDREYRVIAIDAIVTAARLLLTDLRLFGPDGLPAWEPHRYSEHAFDVWFAFEDSLLRAIPKDQRKRVKTQCSSPKESLRNYLIATLNLNERSGA